MSIVCQICLKEISDKRMENGFDSPHPYPRHIEHELKGAEGESLLKKEYLVCSRRCDDLTKLQFKGEILKGGLVKLEKGGKLVETGNTKMKDLGS